MRRLLAYFSQPGRFIFVVAVIVLAGAALLWHSMRAAPEVPPPPTPPAVTERDATIARALLDMAGRAFEEPLSEPLEEGVKQADFALVQALLRTDIPPDGAVVEKMELRRHDLGAYHFQRVHVPVGNDPLPFLTNLYDSLKAWADRAELAQAGKSGENAVWIITVMGVVTHEIVLSRDSVTLHPGSEAKQTLQKPARLPRHRNPGEPARLVIVIDDMGEDMSALRTLIRLPYHVTCAVWPRSTHAKKTAETAFGAGREVLIHQPAEPMKYPEMNPGPNALFVSLPDTEIEDRVRDSLKRVPHAVGMNNHMGSRFTRDARASSAMTRALKGTGLFVLDSMTHPGSVLHEEAGKQGIPNLKRDIFLDADPAKASVLRQLRKAEKIALATGRAVAIGHPLPETLAALREWEGMRDPQVELVTLSDLLESP